MKRKAMPMLHQQPLVNLLSFSKSAPPGMCYSVRGRRVPRCRAGLLFYPFCISVYFSRTQFSMCSRSWRVIGLQMDL